MAEMSTGLSHDGAGRHGWNIHSLGPSPFWLKHNLCVSIFPPPPHPAHTEVRGPTHTEVRGDEGPTHTEVRGSVARCNEELIVRRKVRRTRRAFRCARHWAKLLLFSGQVFAQPVRRGSSQSPGSLLQSPIESRSATFLRSEPGRGPPAAHTYMRGAG